MTPSSGTAHSVETSRLEAIRPCVDAANTISTVDRFPKLMAADHSRWAGIKEWGRWHQVGDHLLDHVDELPGSYGKRSRWRKDDSRPNLDRGLDRYDGQLRKQAG